MFYKVNLSTKIKTSELENGTGIIVVEPDDYTDEQIKNIRKKGYKVLAYLSVGTIEKERPWYNDFKKYKLRQLEDWPKEFYVNVKKKAWRDFLVSRAKMLKGRGFDGWWLDNIDVYSEYKGNAMFTAIVAVFQGIKALNGYVMINGGSEWLDDAFDKGISVRKYINGYTQEEVFSRILDYSGEGKFGKQKKDDGKYYRTMLKKAIKNKVDGFCLEYTRDKEVKGNIKTWCKDNNVGYYISGDVNL